MTDSERVHFDLARFMVRPAILVADAIEETVDQVDRTRLDPESLPAAHRAVAGGRIHGGMVRVGRRVQPRGVRDMARARLGWLFS